jgi:phosphopantothenoylcysteine decarboxylase/phosphopantothenate--cysteine ligase
MKQLFNKHILLGVTGSIAAFKAAELVRQLRSHGAEVRVVMTPSSTEFVTALTFHALSNYPVHSDFLDVAAEQAMSHIELSRWADIIVVAPASANFLARLSQGRADDLLSAVALASTCPVAVCPAMNQSMWNAQTTQQNIAELKRKNISLFGPVDGDQACGDVGMGRMMEPEEIAGKTAAMFKSECLAGKTILVTAGPTQEPIDPVRFLSNRSSGKMGFAIAEAAVEAGAKCILVTGPVHLDTPIKVQRIDVDTAQNMHEQVLERVGQCDIIIATAAVADYRLKERAEQKIKKSSSSLQLDLVQNPDILADVTQRFKDIYSVGFAAETENLIANAEQKRNQKDLDMIVANPVNQPGLGFDSNENQLTVLWQEGHRELPRAQKSTLARQLIRLIADRLTT